jgi:hypothetical protein
MIGKSTLQIKVLGHSDQTAMEHYFDLWDTSVVTTVTIAGQWSKHTGNVNMPMPTTSGRSVE